MMSGVTWYCSPALPVTTFGRAEIPIAQVAYRGHAHGELILQCPRHHCPDFRSAVARNAIECHRPAVGDQMRMGVDQARKCHIRCAQEELTRGWLRHQSGSIKGVRAGCSCVIDADLIELS